MKSSAYKSERQASSAKRKSLLNRKHSCLCHWRHLCYKICCEQATFLFCIILTTQSLLRRQISPWQYQRWKNDCRIRSYISIVFFYGHLSKSILEHAQLLRPYTDTQIYSYWFQTDYKVSAKAYGKREILVTSHRNLQATQAGCKTMGSWLVCAFGTTLSHWYNKHMDIYMTTLKTGQWWTLFEQDSCNKEMEKVIHTFLSLVTSEGSVVEP